MAKFHDQTLTNMQAALYRRRNWKRTPRGLLIGWNDARKQSGTPESIITSYGRQAYLP